MWFVLGPINLMITNVELLVVIKKKANFAFIGWYNMQIVEKAILLIQIDAL